MAKLSAEQRELKLRAYNTKGKKKKQQIKQQRSHILHQLNKQAKLIDRQQLNKINSCARPTSASNHNSRSKHRRQDASERPSSWSGQHSS